MSLCSILGNVTTVGFCGSHFVKLLSERCYSVKLLFVFTGKYREMLYANYPGTKQSLEEITSLILNLLSQNKAEGRAVNMSWEGEALQKAPSQFWELGKKIPLLSLTSHQLMLWAMRFKNIYCCPSLHNCCGYSCCCSCWSPAAPFAPQPPAAANSIASPAVEHVPF